MIEASDLTKLTRWVIPGWLTYLAFYVFVSIDIIFSPSGGKRIFPSVADFISGMTEINALLTVVLVAAAGVPLGFIIYQIYFYLRWNSPFSRDGLLPPLLTGRRNDLKMITKDIKFGYQERNNKWRDNWVKHPLFTRDHKYRWRYIELLFYEATQKNNDIKEGLATYSRHRYLHEVTHTLGASIVALYVGFLGYCFLKFYFGLTDISKNIVAIVVLVTILFFLLNREDKALELLEKRNTRRKTTDEPVSAYDFDLRVFGRDKWKVSFSLVYPGALYLFALASLHWMLNPIFNPENNITDIALRASLLVLAIVIWILSVNKSYGRTRNGYYLVLGFSFFVTLFISIFQEKICPKIDWALFTNILLFLFANLILFNNRKNANDDMIALEYYTLKRYISKDFIEIQAGDKTSS